MTLRLSAALLLMPLVAAGQHARADAQPAPDALARAVQKRYETIRDFSAAFEHTYRGGVLRTRITERGVASVKKPGMMRWIYEAPERKEFVSDGRRIYAYIPKDRQVVVSVVPSDDAAPLPILFLTGKGDVTRDFVASLPEEPAGNHVTLKLTPRARDADYAHMVLVLETPSLRILGLTTVDLQGGDSSFTFSRLKENQGLSDKQFTFRIPAGVDVLTDDGAR